jgi:hypothetical protein
MTTDMRARLRYLAALPLLVVAACGGGESAEPESASTSEPAEAAAAPQLPQKDEPFELDPANFVDKIDNPYWPMTPGSRWVYREIDVDGTVQRVVVTVTDRTKTIEDIQATVVRDTVTEDGEVVEDTFDWYAQDRWGNVWYLGEATKEYDGAKVSTEGSWEAGVDGALAGVIVPGDPEPGLAYRQEYYEGEAEDEAVVLAVDEKAEVPQGSYEDVLMTKDLNPLEPDLVEHKFYAEGVGPVLALTVSGAASREDLVSFVSG